VTAAPVFIGDDLVFWSVARGHQADTGAFIPSSASAVPRDIWQEGLTIPPLKVWDAGMLRTDVLELYLSNMRYREMLHGDLLAQVGAIEKGRARLEELCELHGVTTVTAYLDEIIAYSSRRMLEELREIPDGTYEAIGWLDTDGASFDIPVRVAVTVDSGEVTVDYTGSGPQGPGGINGSWGTAVAAGTSPFLYYVDADIPRNHGCIEHIRVIAPVGTICHAAFPASTHVATVNPSDLMQEVVNKAMARAAPDRVLAGTARGAQNVVTVAGEGLDGSGQWGTLLFNGSGGSGASAKVDGWPVINSLAAFGGMRTAPIEEIELLFPLRIPEWEIETDSMGFGRQIGGPGVRFTFEPLEGDVFCSAGGDARRNPPHGVLGGTAGLGGGAYVTMLDGRRAFIEGAGDINVRQGESWHGVSSGGGGYGDPMERPVEQVRADVQDGVVSVERAGDTFGVIFASLEPYFEVAEDATRAARAGRADAARELITPTQPRAGCWLEDNERSGDERWVNPSGGRDQA
jgi:N-methylhydantoinase B